MIPPARLPRSRQVGVVVAEIYVLLSSLYLVLIARFILEPHDMSFDRLTLPLYWIGAVLGFIYTFVRGHEKLRMAWVTIMTLVCLSRAFTLALSEVDYLTDWQQVTAALSWLLVWVGAVLAALALTAEQLLARAPDEERTRSA